MHCCNNHGWWGPDVLWQVASGMNYLHNECPMRIVHRDLKSPNILVQVRLCCHGVHPAEARDVVLVGFHYCCAG